MDLHPKLKPFMDQLKVIDTLLKLLPEGLPEPQVYQDASNDWEVAWYVNPDNGVYLNPLKGAVLWYTYIDGVGLHGEFLAGDMLPECVTTAVKTLWEK